MMLRARLMVQLLVEIHMYKHKHSEVTMQRDGSSRTQAGLTCRTFAAMPPIKGSLVSDELVADAALLNLPPMPTLLPSAVQNTHVVRTDQSFSKGLPGANFWH